MTLNKSLWALIFSLFSSLTVRAADQIEEESPFQWEVRTSIDGKETRYSGVEANSIMSTGLKHPGLNLSCKLKFSRPRGDKFEGKKKISNRKEMAELECTANNMTIKSKPIFCTRTWDEHRHNDETELSISSGQSVLKVWASCFLK